MLGGVVRTLVAGAFDDKRLNNLVLLPDNIIAFFSYIHSLYAEPIFTTRSMVNIPFPPPNQNLSQTRSHISTVMEESLYDKPTYKKVISDKGIENIKFELYNEKSEKQSKVCAITREKFKDQEEVAILPCNHIFNKEAILTWLTTKSAECPICRYKLESKEIKCEREGENIIPQETINTYVNIRRAY